MALSKVVQQMMEEQGINANGYADGFIDEDVHGSGYHSNFAVVCFLTLVM